ncbi:hypothetical protein P7C70_g1379, partial [Phenoliferia sp. Uapishka_3]
MIPRDLSSSTTNSSPDIPFHTPPSTSSAGFPLSTVTPPPARTPLLDDGFTSSTPPESPFKAANRASLTFEQRLSNFDKASPSLGLNPAFTEGLALLKEEPEDQSYRMGGESHGEFAGELSADGNVTGISGPTLSFVPASPADSRSPALQGLPNSPDNPFAYRTSIYPPPFPSDSSAQLASPRNLNDPRKVSARQRVSSTNQPEASPTFRPWTAPSQQSAPAPPSHQRPATARPPSESSVTSEGLLPSPHIPPSYGKHLLSPKTSKEEKRGSVLLGLVGLGAMGRKKSSRKSSSTDSKQGPLVASNDWRQRDEELSGSETPRTHNGVHARENSTPQLGGVTPKPVVLVKGRPASRSFSSGSSILQKSPKVDQDESGEALPSFPAARMELSEHHLTGEDLEKLEIPSSTFLRSKPTWHSRYISLTSFPSPTHNSAPVFMLHSFRSSQAGERERDRLELTKASIVCVPDDSAGRIYALKITGQDRQQGKEESWVIGMENVKSLKIWMEQLKAVVQDLANPPKPDPASMKRTHSESTSSHSLENAGSDHAHSSGSPRSSVSGSRFRSSKVDPKRTGSPSPARSARTPSSNEEGGSSLSEYSFGIAAGNVGRPGPSPPTTDKSGLGESESEELEDPSTFHPYRRGSIPYSTSELPARLTVPGSSPSIMSRRGSGDDSSSQRGSIRTSLASAFEERRGSDSASFMSTTSSLMLPRGPPPSMPLPNTPPSTVHSSPPSRSPSVRTNGSTPLSNHSKRISVASSTLSSTSSLSVSQRFRNPPPPPSLPPPTSALPPTPPSALPLPPTPTHQAFD